jgi:hypothetical protein
MRWSNDSVGGHRKPRCMTVSQLRSQVVPGHVAAARAAVEAAARVQATTLDVYEVSEGIAELTALESQVTALKLSLLAEADRREAADETGAADTAAWAAKLTGSTRAVMAGGLWLARMLQEKYGATREAFARGRIGVEQVRVIVKAAERLPEAVTDEQRAVAEAALVAKAVDGMNARRLRQAARRMLEEISRELADQHEADQLDDDEKRAELETWLTMHDNGDGTVSGRFTIPELHGQLLRTALERLSAPRRHGVDKSGAPVLDETLPGSGLTMNWSEGLGAAFVELLEHLPSDGHGAVNATLMVHLDHQHLVDKLAAARLDTGVHISAGEARRLACGAGIVPIVLGGNSEVLDQGRRRRLHTPAQRRALSVHHDSCAAEGCERPFAWCEIHHPLAWSDGGETSLANGVPLCGHHHRRAHDERYYVRHLASGEVRFRRRPVRRR